MVERLSEKGINERLKKLKNWKVVGKHIQRKLKFKNFVETIKFVNKIVPIAEKEEHHPDLAIQNYNELIVSITTHDAGGITEWDFELAKKINELKK